jgi:hypothetical protein
MHNASDLSFKHVGAICYEENYFFDDLLYAGNH